MTEIFRKDEDDFVSLTTQVQQGLDVYPALKEKDERLKSLQYINDQILETEKLIKQMDINLSSVDKTDRARLSQNLRKYRGDVENLRRQLQKYREEFSFQQGQDYLFGDGRQPSEKDKLLDMNARISAQNSKLMEIKKVAFDSEDVSHGIQRELARNTETLQRAINNTKAANQEVGQGNSLVNAINRNICANKSVLWIVLALIIVVIVIILVIKFS